MMRKLGPKIEKQKSVFRENTLPSVQSQAKTARENLITSP